MNNISLSQLKTYAMTNFPDVYRELPSHTALRPKYSSGCFELCIGRLGNAGHYPGSNIKLGDPVYAVNIESRFQLRHDDNYTVILPKDILFEAPFCYLYPNGPPSYTTHDLEILLRYYFESYGVSVPRDPCGPEFQPYGQQFQSACTKVAEGQANNTRISMVTGQLGGIVAGNIEIITNFENHLNGLMVSLNMFKIQARETAERISEGEQREEKLKADKEEAEFAFQAELKKITDESTSWKEKYGKLRKAVLGSLLEAE